MGDRVQRRGLPVSSGLVAITRLQLRGSAALHPLPSSVTRRNARTLIEKEHRLRESTASVCILFTNDLQDELKTVLMNESWCQLRVVGNCASAKAVMRSSAACISA